MNDLDVPPLRELLQAARQRADDLLFSLADFVDVELRLRIVHAPVVPQLIDLGDHASNVQQRLGRNAAAKKACTAEPRIGFDERDFQTLVSRQECGRITTGTAAEDNN